MLSLEVAGQRSRRDGQYPLTVPMSSANVEQHDYSLYQSQGNVGQLNSLIPLNNSAIIHGRSTTEWYTTPGIDRYDKLKHSNS